MKKTLSCLLAVLLLVSVCAMAFADDVVPSVEAEPMVPELSGAVDANGNDVTDSIIITDYADKDTLSEEKQAQLDAAAEALKDLAALVEGNEELKALVGDNEIDAESLFDVSVTSDAVALPVELNLELVNADGFAALLHLVDGVASVVEAEVEDGILTVSLAELGAYAIVSFVEA